MKHPSDLYILVMLRFIMGFIFLWAFLDKLFGWGFATAPEKSWLNGGSPTAGFLKAGVTGPFANFFHGLSGQGWVDWFFMLGLLCIGLALIFGIGMKIAGWSGALLMLLMWFALLFPKNNPVIDDHIVYLFVLIGLATSTTKPGHYWGLGKWWAATQLVQKHRFLE